MRTETDFIGKVEVPKDAYYGSFTTRAKKLFQISSSRVPIELVYAVALIKKCAALANCEVGMLDKRIADAIVAAADEILDGKFDDQFVLDIFQAGAGTPLHMNVNEVIANRAEELLDGKKGQYKLVHPNNQVNMAQSSNDVVPTAIRLAALFQVKKLLIEGKRLQQTLEKKSKKYSNLIKVGRTHLQDAVPISYGQVFDAYAKSVRDDLYRIEYLFGCLEYLGIGGTAVGTGITCHPKFKEKVISHLSKSSGLKLKAVESSVQTTQDMNVFLLASSGLRSYAITLNRIANDLRLLASGPKAGIAEVVLPEVEPGSSIMPGKVNPSVPEAVNMICFRIIANDQAIALAAQSGQLELNFATPLIAQSLLESLQILSNGMKMFVDNCISGLEIDEEKTKENFDRSLCYATVFNPYLGYSDVSKLVREAYSKKIPLKDLIIQKGILSKEDIEKILPGGQK